MWMTNGSESTTTTFRWPTVGRGPAMSSSLLASLPLQLVCQMILTGNPTNIIETGIVGFEPLLEPLPDGYVEFPEDNAAYKIYEELVSWIEAEERCRSEGAHLAIADSRDKIKHINSTKPHPERRLHAGIFRSATDNDWHRIDNGLPVKSIPWACSIPWGSSNCTNILTKEGGLIDNDCRESKSHYVCEITRSTEARGVTVPAGYVPFTRFGVAYKIHNQSLNWNEARKQCIQEGGSLAVVDSREKNNAIMGLERPQELPVYIGIHNMFHTAEWIRVDNGFPATFIPWAPGNPDGAGNCLTLWSNGEGAGDANCQDSRLFVCEIPIPTK